MPQIAKIREIPKNSDVVGIVLFIFQYDRDGNRTALNGCPVNVSWHEQSANAAHLFWDMRCRRFQGR